MAFWDASAVLPLCFHQPANGPVRRLVRVHGRLIVWWRTPVEVRSGLSRLVREGAITHDGRNKALARLAVLRRRWVEVLPTERVRGLAEVMPEQHDVRAADGFQLAAALIWCGERPRRRPFICLDRNLAKAAERVGFAVISPAGSALPPE